MPLETDPRWRLAERVAASAAFQRSKRARDFLLFVCRRAIEHPELPIRESEIRRVVFGRSKETDDPEDTLVRVQASQLRKRLQMYFSTDGAQETTIIDVPKGSYAPVFKPRPMEAPAVAPAPAAPAPTRPIVFPVLAALFALACLILFVQNRVLRGRPATGAFKVEPSVDRLWRQMFGDGRVYLVLSDGNLTMYQDLLQYQLTLPQYQRQRFVELAEERLPDREKQSWAEQLMNREFTSIADINLARRVVTVDTLQGRGTDVVLARHADPSQFQSQNVILAGSRRANPWLELFEGRLNFRSRFEESGRRAYLDNTVPRDGEAATYQVVWNHVGYCRVAYLPNLGGTRSVLVISGSDMASSDAGSEFITSERWVAPLLDELKPEPDGRIPHFEVLLRTQLLLGTAPNFEKIALRVAGR
jgi:hypothetical protein